MPRVLHVAQSADYGLARFLFDLVGDQVERGWTVGFAGPADAPLPEGADRIAWAASREPHRDVPAESRRLAGIVEAFQPDVVHLHSSKAGLVGRLVLRGRRPTIFQPHAWSFLAVGGATRAAAVMWERAAIRWTEVVVCCSQAEYRQGEEHGIRGRYRVVPNAVDLQRFAVVDRREARERLGLGEGPLVACIGRLSHQKGQDVLLDAWPAVRAAVSTARLVLVGDGPDREALAARAGEGVELVGRQPSVEHWLAAADVVAQPSRYEGLAITVLEAMAAGRSIVATDVEGMAEAIGGGGAIVRPGDVGALGEALVHRLRDPDLAAAEGRAGRERAAHSHDLRTWGDRMAELTLGLVRTP
ncbi:MAG TPA: glycosyltransferase [Acidimicrobiales bacterium]|nr:glycosyltransferase [Acidimicrobiales bacterium]